MQVTTPFNEANPLLCHRPSKDTSISVTLSVLLRITAAALFMLSSAVTTYTGLIVLMAFVYATLVFL